LSDEEGGRATDADLRLGALISYHGRRYYVRGLDPLGVANPMAQLEDAETSERIQVPAAALSRSKRDAAIGRSGQGQAGDSTARAAESRRAAAVRIRTATADDADIVRGLLREYGDSLGVDLSFQDFETELADPLAFYELVLLADDACVALRRIDARTCEMKRLYVRPAARGRGLGRALAEAVIAAARTRGYERMLLDTLPTMRAAQALYGSLGFREREPYRHNPVPGATFLELAL
jgi:putative acetyltransferase